MRHAIEATSPLTPQLRVGSALAFASLAIGLSVAFFGSARADSAFKHEWEAASSASSAVDPAYRPQLQAYLDSHPEYRACDADLEEGHGIRMLLQFDAKGSFRTTGELANDAVESCLSSFFEKSPPPLPAKLPLTLPFWFQ